VSDSQDVADLAAAVGYVPQAAVALCLLHQIACCVQEVTQVLSQALHHSCTWSKWLLHRDPHCCSQELTSSSSTCMKTWICWISC
jgi:hypothetical protein